jgi:hypothetical protein
MFLNYMFRRGKIYAFYDKGVVAKRTEFSTITYTG